MHPSSMPFGPWLHEPYDFSHSRIWRLVCKLPAILCPLTQPAVRVTLAHQEGDAENELASPGLTCAGVSRGRFMLEKDEVDALVAKQASHLKRTVPLKRCAIVRLLYEAYLPAPPQGASHHELLVSLIRPAAQNARPPVSSFKVGAVGLGGSGNVYVGVNLELLGLPLFHSVHAEQFLVVNALRCGVTPGTCPHAPLPSGAIPVPLPTGPRGRPACCPMRAVTERPSYAPSPSRPRRVATAASSSASCLARTTSSSYSAIRSGTLRSRSSCHSGATPGGRGVQQTEPVWGNEPSTVTGTIIPKLACPCRFSPRDLLGPALDSEAGGSESRVGEPGGTGTSADGGRGHGSTLELLMEPRDNGCVRCAAIKVFRGLSISA